MTTVMVGWHIKQLKTDKYRVPQGRKLSNFGPLIFDSITNIHLNSIKYLGEIVNRHLWWDHQISCLTDELRGLIFPPQEPEGFFKNTTAESIL